MENNNLKNVNGTIINDDVKAFVSLKDINKIYPNGIQAVYDFNIDIHHHDFIVLVGPSGCGKSTTLRMVAGLEDISSGELYIAKKLSNYIPSKDRDISMVFQSYALYPQMTVYQNIAFPLKARKYDKVKKADWHLVREETKKLFENPSKMEEAIKEAHQKELRFGSVAVYTSTKLHCLHKTMKFILTYKAYTAEELVSKKEMMLADLNQLCEKEKLAFEKKGYHVDPSTFICYDADNNEVHYKAKLTSDEIRNKVFEAARILDLGPYLDRKPKELSGGQMQRVALGRAIVRNAKLFLMDEPLSNLDAKLRVQMRSEIVRIHEAIGATTIYVTHDQTEAMTMATRIAVMSKGWVQQIDEPSTIYHHPNNIFVATFIGSPAMNIFEGTYDDGSLIFTNGYKVKLADDYKRIHDEFYQKKIEQTRAFINKPAVIKMRGILPYEKLRELFSEKDKKKDEKNDKKVFALTEEEKKCLEEIQQVGNALTYADNDVDKGDGGVILALLKDMDPNNKKSVGATISALHAPLYNLIGITSKELSILHNAETFNKDKKKDSQEEVLFYNKRKGKAKKAVKGYKNVLHVKDSNLILTNNLYTVLSSLLMKYESYLKGPHPVRIGVRPENIHLDQEYNDTAKSPAFTIQSDVVELLGSELRLHANYSGTDRIAKISTGTLVKPHENISLTFDTDKVLVFDPNSGDTVADWVKVD